MPHLSLSLLGPPEFRLDGQPLTAFRSDKVRALLTYLAVESDRPHRRESLAGLLWPDEPEGVAGQNLRQALSLLRKALGDREAASPVLRVTRKTIQLNAESEVSVDVATFSELLAACAGHRHRRTESCRACVERLAEAAELYRGDLLAGFSLPSATFEEWLVTERERLHQQALDALCHLAEHHERRGEHERVRQYAQRQLDLEPWRETAHRQMMRALALSDQRRVALTQYEHCRRVLAEELGAEPEEETTLLYARIQGAKKASDLRALSLTPPHNLPAALSPFVGRETALVEIEDLLQDPDCRLLSLVGPGGSGKTRLALEAASRQRYSFEHGVFFVSLAPLQAVEAIAPTIARAIGFSFYAAEDAQDPKQQLLDYLHRRSLLLVLDNFEHLLSGAEVATDILRTAPEIKVLVTSRVVLRAKGEHPFFVGGMDCPETVPVAAGDVARYSAVQLFLSSGRPRRPDLASIGEDLVHVAQVCRLVEGMPLAIILAAAWLNMLTPAEIAAELSAQFSADLPDQAPIAGGRGLDFLADDGHGVPERQRSMRAVFDWSWNLLGERERAVMQAFSVFRGGCTQEAAQEVTGASLRELRTLVDHSLLQRTDAPRSRSGAEGRYEVHELLRQYSAERLQQTPDGGKAVFDRHAAYYAAALGQWADDMKGSRQQAALAAMEADLDNARAAWGWAVKQRHVALVDRGAEALGLLFDWQLRFEEGEAVFGPAVKALSGASSGDELCTRIKVLAWEARFSLDYERASAMLQQCLALLERPELAERDARRERALVLKQLGHDDKGNLPVEDRVAYLEQSLALYREVGDRWQMSHTSWLLALEKWHAFEFDEAVKCAEEGLAIARALGDEKGTARHLVQLGNFAHFGGQFARGMRLTVEAMDILREVGDQFDIAWGLGMSGILFVGLGRFGEARSTFEESLRILHDLGRHDVLIGSELWLGATLMQLGLYEAAREHVESYLAMSQRANSSLGMAIAPGFLAKIAIATGAYDQVEALLQESLPMSLEIGAEFFVGEALSSLACAALRMGKQTQAREKLLEAMRIVPGPQYRRIRCPEFPLTVMALLLLDGGKVERSAELWALAMQNPVVANSVWFHDIAGREIVAAAGTLPSETVAAAQARGRARDLWETAKELVAELEGNGRLTNPASILRPEG